MAGTEAGGQSDYQTFLEAKHARFATTERIVAEAVRRALGREMVSRRRIVRGEVNEVYEIATTDGQALIVRISHQAQSGFAGERWALARCAEAGIPVAEMLLLEPFDTGDGIVTVCVETKLPGAPLDEVLQADPDRARWRRLVTRAGKILAAIHEIPVTGYGYVKEGGATHYASWSAFLSSRPLDAARLEQAALAHGESTAIVRRALEIVRGRTADLEQPTSQLLHGDFSTKHLLIDHERISGVLDLEDCQGGDPAKDFAWWEFFFGAKLPSAWLEQGYGNGVAFTEEHYRRRQFYRLLLGLEALQYYAGDGNTGGVRLALAALQRDVV
ncbi:MAG: phosphotransferase family protein [Dehalococcoidia bacterium]